MYGEPKHGNEMPFLQGYGHLMEGRNNLCCCGGYKTGRAIIPYYADNLNMQWLLILFSVIDRQR